MIKWDEYDNIFWEVSSNTMCDTIYFDEDSYELHSISREMNNKFEYDTEEPLCLNISIYATKNDKSVKIAAIELFLVKAFEEKMDMYDIMDGYSGDAEIISLLLDSNEYQELYDEYCHLDNVFVGVLQELYIYPKFRGCGFSKWLNENMYTMVKLALNIGIGSLVTHVRPYKEDKYGEYVENDTDMTNIMCRMFERNNWREAEKKFYVKSFKDYIEE